LYYKDQDLWRSNIEGGQQQALTEGDLLAFWELESVEDKWWTGGFNPRPFVSPNGRFIAFTLTGRNMVIVDVANPASPRTLSSGSTLMAWSPDSRYLAYGYNYALHLYDTITDHSRVITAVSGRGPQSFTWSSDGRYIGFVCCFTPPEGEYEGIEYGHLRQYDMETGRTETIGEATSSVGGGASLLCWQDAGYFAPFLETGQSSHCTPPGSNVFYTSVSPDGNLFAHMLFSPEEDPLHFHLLTVENNQTGETLWEMELAEAANRLAWSPDGRYLLLNHYYPGLSPIWRLPADGTSTPEPIIEEAYLMGVVPMWQDTQ
jgi:Tol biopolymer transport system component